MATGKPQARHCNKARGKHLWCAQKQSSELCTTTLTKRCRQLSIQNSRLQRLVSHVPTGFFGWYTRWLTTDLDFGIGLCEKGVRRGIVPESTMFSLGPDNFLRPQQTPQLHNPWDMANSVLHMEFVYLDKRLRLMGSLQPQRSAGSVQVPHILYAAASKNSCHRCWDACLDWL